MRWMVTAALAAGLLTGCGIGTAGKSTTTPAPPRTTTTATTPAITTATTTTATATTDTTPAPASGGCSPADPAFAAGGPLDCVRRGANVHLVHQHDILAMKSLLARLLAVEQSPEITGTTRTFQPKGVYVRVTLAVTNLTRRPRPIRPGQTALVIGKRQFDEVVALENGQDARSLLSRAGPRRPIAAGASVTGDVVFDVPTALAAQVPGGAWVAIAGFGPTKGIDGRPALGAIALGA